MENVFKDAVLFFWSEVLLMCKVFGKKFFKDKVVPCTLTFSYLLARAKRQKIRHKGLKACVWKSPVVYWLASRKRRESLRTQFVRNQRWVYWFTNSDRACLRELHASQRRRGQVKTKTWMKIPFGNRAKTLESGKRELIPFQRVKGNRQRRRSK